MKQKIEVGSQCQERFLCDEEFPELRTIGVQVGGLSKLIEHHLVENKSSNTVMLSANLNGEALLNCSSLDIKLRSGNIFYIPKNTRFRLQLSSQQRQTAWLLLDAELWELGDSPWYIDSDFGSSLNHCLEGLDLERHHPVFSAVRVNLVQQLELLLNRLLKREPQYGCDPRIRKLVRSLEKNVDGNWDQQRLCETAGLSKSQLYRLFKNDYQCSPIDYLNKLRLKKAQQMLRHTQYPITIIAMQLGFRSSGYFSTLFKNGVGLTPRQYRKGDGAKRYACQELES